MKNNNKASVFILLGQSNAVGHGIPMEDKDKICQPLKNVFGLKRETNQSLDNENLFWSGYTSHGMNVAEEQDHTYSVANCLARLWQDKIDVGNELSDLYIVQIAIGAQGVTNGFMWNPDYERKLVPGKLGTVDISLYPFTVRILSQIKKSLYDIGKTPDAIKMHWRGGESDAFVSEELVHQTLKPNYNTLFNGFYNALGEKVPTVLHKIVCHERCAVLDPSGKAFVKMNYINEAFEEMAMKSANMTVFDVCDCPHYVHDQKENGLFIEDAIHYNPQTNRWVAEQIMDSFSTRS